MKKVKILAVGLVLTFLVSLPVGITVGLVLPRYILGKEEIKKEVIKFEHEELLSEPKK